MESGKRLVEQHFGGKKKAVLGEFNAVEAGPVAVHRQFSAPTPPSSVLILPSMSLDFTHCPYLSHLSRHRPQTQLLKRPQKCYMTFALLQLDHGHSQYHSEHETRAAVEGRTCVHVCVLPTPHGGHGGWVLLMHSPGQAD